MCSVLVQTKSAQSSFASMGLIAVLLLCFLGVLYGQESVYDDCPRGTYREHYLSRECKLCVKGYYGETHGLTTPTCSAPCPVGRYGDIVGAKTVDDCRLCPPGVVGSEEGLTSSSCSRPCPKGRYSSIYGATSIKDCIVCPTGYYEWQCYKNRQ